MFSDPTAVSLNLERHVQTLTVSLLDTKRGQMIAIGDKEAIYLLEFEGRRGLRKGIERLKQRANSALTSGMTEPIRSLKEELTQYFEGKLKEFSTPFLPFGSPFQRHVWEELQKIPYGQTCSYAEVAARIGKPSAYRAVANANGANRLAILIPCHRVINASGDLGGYGGGIAHKEWLLKLEKAGL